MNNKVFSEIIDRDWVYSIPGYVFFLYLLLPFRFWEPFVFYNQTESIVISVFFSGALLLFILPKVYQTDVFQLTKIDLILLIYSIYLLFRFKYPLEKEIFYQAFSIVCIYLYFRNLSEKYLRGLLFLLPIAVIVQMLNGINRFTMPWHNLSHIGGIFQNTGLFGGFAALGFIVSFGLFLFSDSRNRFIKSIVFLFFGVVLFLQVYASGSRASWVAALIAFFFLLYRFILPSLRGALATKQSKIAGYLFASCLLVTIIFFSNRLYRMKKDSADGRLLIAKVSLNMAKAAPVFGNGIGGFRAEYLNYQACYFQKHPDSPWAYLADDTETPFDEFLKILIEQGIIGLVLFTLLLYFLFEKEISETENQYILQAAILFILIFGLFSYPFDKFPFSVLFVFSIAGIAKNRNPVFKLQSRIIRYLRILIILLFFSIALPVALNAWDYAKSCRKWNAALADFASDREKSLSILKILYHTLNNNPVFLTTYGKTLSFGEYYSEATVVLEKAVKRLPLSTSYIELGNSYDATGFPEKALDSWNRARRTVPSRFAPAYLSMKLYFKNKEYDKAREQAEQLLAKKNKIDNPEINTMRQEARDILNFHPPPR